MVQSVRGMKDLLFEEQAKHRFIIDTCLSVARRFCYSEMSTPLLEFSEVFEKTLGANTDILEKETYSFIDKGGHHITLRPEGTASIVRSLISQKLYQNQPLRIFYSGPMFRYERPQKGRLRQFHQAGVEIFGESSPEAELELIEIAQMILKELNILSKSQLLINSIGDVESQKNYRKKLVEHLSPYTKDLSVDSQKRLLKNPLRILDSKDKKDIEILKSAPKIHSTMNKQSKEFYNRVLSLLSQRNIAFKEEDSLVRGLDYYCHSVFEYVSAELGAQSTFLAGGRYDGLVENMGGASIPAVGWACGIERMALLCSPHIEEKPLLGLLNSNKDLNSDVLQLAQLLREKDHRVYVAKTEALGKQMKKANKMNCSFVFILDLDQWKDGKIILKDMQTGNQKTIPKKDISHWQK